MPVVAEDIDEDATHRAVRHLADALQGLMRLGFGKEKVVLRLRDLADIGRILVTRDFTVVYSERQSGEDETSAHCEIEAIGGCSGGQSSGMPASLHSPAM